MNGWDPAAWIALAALGATLLGAIMLGCWIGGKHSNRIETLERRADGAEAGAKETRDDVANARAQMAGFDATLKALERTVHDGFLRMDQTIRDAVASIAPQRRSRSSGDN